MIPTQLTVFTSASTSASRMFPVVNRIMSLSPALKSTTPDKPRRAVDVRVEDVHADDFESDLVGLAEDDE